MLSRIQFGFTISFHYIFTTLSIGISLFLVIAEGFYLKTGKILYFHLIRFWSKIFGIIFVLGVATGLLLEFEFGTNWANYSKFVGDVFGSLLLAETFFAFFVESTFLAIVLFGWTKVGKKFHFLSTIMVSIGSHMSAVWIVIANSWQQTPAGHQIVNSRAEMADFSQVIFNPSSLERIWHVVGGSWLAGAFFILAVSAYYILRKRVLDFAKTSFKIALWIAAISSLMQLASGHKSVLGICENQPIKFAAFEGHYPKDEPAPIYLFGWVDEKKKEVRYGLKIPKLASLLLHGDMNKSVPGLNSFPEKNHPPVNAVFQSYHIMVFLGFGLILLCLLGIYFLWRKSLFQRRGLLKIFLVSAIGPLIANQTGWFSAEVGRQPFLVYHLLRTSEGLSANLSANYVLFSLLAFILVYAFLFVVFVYFVRGQVLKGPDLEETAQFVEK